MLGWLWAIARSQIRGCSKHSYTWISRTSTCGKNGQSRVRARACVCVCVCARDHCCCCVLVFTHSARCATGGNLNFITGAGGYLQNFLYGYSQIRLAGVRQLVMPLAPSLPPGNVTRVKLRNISLAGVRMSLWYNATDVCLQQEPAPSREAAAGSLQVVCASGEVCVKAVPSSRPACVTSQPLTIRAVPI